MQQETRAIYSDSCRYLFAGVHQNPHKRFLLCENGQPSCIYIYYVIILKGKDYAKLLHFDYRGMAFVLTNFKLCFSIFSI